MPIGSNKLRDALLHAQRLKVTTGISRRQTMLEQAQQQGCTPCALAWKLSLLPRTGAIGSLKRGVR